MEQRPGSVVILVHGTFGGSATEHGRLWWQRGGAFRDWLEARLDGTGIEVRPFRWSGQNSEAERRRSGRDLLAQLRDLDGQGRGYHLVGHSHGGSVIWAALRDSNGHSTQGSLQGLKSWTTAGTPFLAYGVRYADILFLGPLLLGLWLIYRLLGGLVTAAVVRDLLFTWAHVDTLILLGLLWPVIGLVLLFCLIRIWTVARATRATLADNHGDLSAWWGYTSGRRWLRLCADEDEAVNGLGKVLTVREPVVPRGGLLKVFGGVADGIFWQQVRAIAFGNDLPGRKPAHAGYVPLPQEASEHPTDDDRLNRRLVERANAGSPLVADRLRRLLGELSYGKLVRSDLPAEVGTAEGEDWTAILVHCAYFSDLPHGADVEGPATATADSTVAARVAAHVLEHEAVDPAQIPADEALALLARRRSLFRSQIRGRFTLGTVQTLTTAGLIFLLVVAGLGIELAQRRAWSLTDDAQADSVLRDSVGLLRVCNGDEANADWCRALLEAAIVASQQSDRLGSGAAEILAGVDDRALDEAYDQIGAKTRFPALLAASDRLASVKLVPRALRFVTRARGMIALSPAARPPVGPTDPADLRQLLECVHRYAALGDGPEAARLARLVAVDSMRNVEILQNRKGFVAFGADFSAGSLHCLLAALEEILRLDPTHFDDPVLDRIAAIIVDHAEPATRPTGPMSVRAPAADLATLTALLRARNRAAKADEVGKLVEGTSLSGPIRLDLHIDLSRDSALPPEPSFAGADPESIKVEARTYHDRLRTAPIVFNNFEQAGDPFGAAFRERAELRARFLATALRLGLVDLQRDALASLVEDSRRIIQGGLPVQTNNGPRLLNNPAIRDRIVGHVLQALSTRPDAAGFADLIEGTGFAKLVPLGSGPTYLAVNLRLLEAHCAWSRGDIAAAARIGDGVKASRDAGRWVDVTKRQRSDLNRALAVIDCAARRFRVARSEGEGCDIEDRLHVWAELLRHYCEAATSPATGPGHQPSVRRMPASPIFDVVEIAPIPFMAGVVPHPSTPPDPQ